MSLAPSPVDRLEAGSDGEFTSVEAASIARYFPNLARGVFASRSAPPRMRWLPDRATGSSKAPTDKPKTSGDAKKSAP